MQQSNMVAAYSQGTKTNQHHNQTNWVLGRKSNLAIENMLMIYKTIIIPIWTYGMELWGCASKSNISIIQRSQSKILRMVVDAPWYVSNATLYADLGISTKNATNINLHSKPTKTRSPQHYW
jgi:hypothetical protein